MKYPSHTRSGDPLIYHRMTGLGGFGETFADIRARINNGYVLQPFSERGEDAEMFGLEPIDVVAGDGDLIFCSPYAPVRHTYAHFQKPGVVFRLKDLVETGHAVYVRPVDFQTFYQAFLAQSGIAPMVRQVMRDAASAYEEAEALSDLGGVLSYIRKSIESDKPYVGLAQLEARVSPTPKKLDFSRSAESALSFVEGYQHLFGEEDLKPEDYDRWEAVFKAASDVVVLMGQEAWQSGPGRAEVCVEGSLPLSLAVAVFDNERFSVLDPSSDALEGFSVRGVAASANGNRSIATR